MKTCPDGFRRCAGCGLLIVDDPDNYCSYCAGEAKDDYVPPQMTEPDKLLCDSCYAKVQRSEVLTAPHPFLNGTIFGCPACREADKLSCICDEPGCWNLATCGNPSPDGYRTTCYQHQP